MPDIGTTYGFAQGVGLGLGLLMIAALRCRRYATDIVRSFVPLWLVICIGLMIGSFVEVGLDAVTVATRTPIIAALPVAAAFYLRNMFGLRAP